MPFFIPMFSIAAISSSPVAAQGFMWADGYQSSDIYREEPPRRVRPQTRESVLPKGADRLEKLAAEGRKPEGPLVVAVSIQRQNVKVYDANGLFAESPISSGMAGHTTPMGVFSVIQKSKYHRSNIYSGAPMPYMQRVTWSGIAMHAGVLPGYPASHGCIRVPMSFAMKMWGWTRMGARVVIAPGEVSPAPIVSAVLDSLTPPAPIAEAPVETLPKIQTADASGSFAMDTSRAPADVTQVAADDVASVASIVEDKASRAALETESEGFPPPPPPVTLDLSDIVPPATDPLRPATDVATQPDEPSVTGTAAATVAPVAGPAREAAAPLIKRNLPVAIFVSRKDGKIYVRQNFTPILDLPIEIAAAEKPLGTHVFTAHAMPGEGRKLQWSVVTVPAIARQPTAASDERTQRRHPAAVGASPVAEDTPSDALARLTIPPELMARLGEALPNGSSLVVSDQGIAQGETGEGTDFIVRLR